MLVPGVLSVAVTIYCFIRHGPKQLTDDEEQSFRF